MLNMKAMPAAGGAGLAAYLWKEAVGPEAPEAPAVKQDLDYWVAEGADYDDLVEFAYAERLARVQAAMAPEPHHALHGLSDVGIDHELLRDKAEQDVMAALDRYDAAQADRLATFGVEYRRDTSPELAELLKVDLEAVPRLQDLKNLLSAKAADGQQIEGRFYRKDRADQMTMGSLELVFSADKSVSVVFGLVSPEERAAIAAAQSRAVDRAMCQIAEKIGVVRSRRGGLDRRDPADLTWVQWQHRMSRRGDPQLHTHVSLINVVRSRVDGKVGTLDTFLLHGLYPSVRETYHRALADELRELDLQVQFDPKVPAAVLTEMPERLLRHFSGRTADAEKWLQEKHGVNFGSLTPHQRSTWLGHAAAKVRPPKAMYYVPGNGHAAWHARAVGAGYVPPPQFISPQALQRAGIVHATVQQHSQAQTTTPPEQPGRAARVDKRRQSKGINPKADGRYNRGGGRYEEDTRGQRI